MQDFSSSSSSSRGCGLSGCFTGIVILVLIGIVIGAWVVPTVFQDEIEARVCPEGTELKSYTRTTNGTSQTQGHSCYSIESGREIKDLGARLILPTICVTIMGILGIVLIIIMAAMRSSRNVMASIPAMQQSMLNQAQRQGGYGTFSSQPSTTPDSNDDLADRLQQLNEALNNGLITQEEYDQKREDILKQF